jgi:myo-inositol-1(or 4)-monophosphatase
MDTSTFLAFADRTARSAGDLLRRLREEGKTTVELKYGYEVVTSADLRSDELICQSIKKQFPAHRVLSEETWDGWRDGMLDGPVWVVDPLDGSVNFAHGHPAVAVSIALAVDGVVEVGAVFAPFFNQMFTARRGGGARLNGRDIMVGKPTRLADALVSTGFPHDRSALDPVIERVRRLVRSCRDVRRSGSPAIDICWVAAGILDAHTESLAPWDVAAAGLVAAEAGALRGNLLPEVSPFPIDLAGSGVVFSAPSIFEKLKQLLSANER